MPKSKRFKKGLAGLTIIALLLTAILAVAIPAQAGPTPPGNQPAGGNSAQHRQNGTGIGVSMTASGTLVNEIDTTFNIAKTVTPTSLDLILGGDAGQLIDSIDVTSQSTAKLLAGVKGNVRVVNGGGADTQGLTIKVVVLAQARWGGFKVVKSQAVDVSSRPAIASHTQASYGYAINFPPVPGARAYKATAYVTITNHSGHLGRAFGPSPSNGFKPPKNPTGNVYVPSTAALSDTETVPAGLTVETVSASLNGTAQSNLTGPWTLTAPFAGTYHLELVKSVRPTAAGSFQLSDVASVAGKSASASVAITVTGASIAGRVIDDLNGNDVADPGEPGIAGVAVQLQQAGNPVASTVTEAEGDYLFSPLVPGAYDVTTVSPDGSQPIGPLSVPVTVAAGQNLTGIDFFDVFPASATGRVINDLNGNGLADEGEPGIAGVEIQIQTGGVLLSSTETIADGSYALIVQFPGAYSILEVPPAGLTSEGPTSVTLTLSSGETDTGIDFLGFFPASISGVVHDDANGNGVADPGEVGLENVTVQLERAGSVLSTASTDPAGRFSFTGLTPGDYVILQVVPEGYNAIGPISIVQSLQSGDAVSALDFFDTAVISPLGLNSVKPKH